MIISFLIILDNTCESGWYRPIENYCVKAFHFAIPVVKARQLCQYNGADLAVIPSNQIQQIINHYLDTQGLSYFWYSIGLHQNQHGFKWMMTQQYNHYFHWYPGNPKSDLKCTILHRRKSDGQNATWKWRSYGCDFLHAWYLCSKSKPYF